MDFFGWNVMLHDHFLYEYWKDVKKAENQSLLTKNGGNEENLIAKNSSSWTTPLPSLKFEPNGRLCTYIDMDYSQHIYGIWKAVKNRLNKRSYNIFYVGMKRKSDCDMTLPSVVKHLEDSYESCRGSTYKDVALIIFTNEDEKFKRILIDTAGKFSKAVVDGYALINAVLDSQPKKFQLKIIADEIASMLRTEAKTSFSLGSKGNTCEKVQKVC